MVLYHPAPSIHHFLLRWQASMQAHNSGAKKAIKLGQTNRSPGNIPTNSGRMLLIGNSEEEGEPGDFAFFTTQPNPKGRKRGEEGADGKIVLFVRIRKSTLHNIKTPNIKFPVQCALTNCNTTVCIGGNNHLILMVKGIINLVRSYNCTVLVAIYLGTREGQSQETSSCIAVTCLSKKR